MWMRWLRNCLFVLTCAMIVLGVGSVVPRLAFAGNNVGAYTDEKKAFAKFALVYDSELREWPFPMGPTVARRVTEVSGTHNEDSRCNNTGHPKTSPYYTGDFAGDYKAEVIHYGPSFIPTGKNVFNCDGAETYFFLLPRGEGALFDILGIAVLIGALGVAIGTIVIPAFLVLGGGLLLVRGTRRNYRKVGLAALVCGVVTAATAFLSIATTAI